MNKKELIDEIAEKTGFTKKDTAIFLDGFIEVVTESLAADRKVAISGFGAFETKYVEERTGIIQVGDRKGETYTTPAHRKLKFKVGKALKESINE